MSFWGNLFSKKHTESVVLIDVGADSVAGAYVRYTEGEQPLQIYAKRLSVEVRGEEPVGEATLRAFKELGDALIHDGAPLLVHASGSGDVDNILVSIDAPWQKTSVRTEQFEQNMPFVFNKQMVATALEKSSVVPPGEVLVDESIIGTVLNGYETREPYGKLVHRASVSILASYIDGRFARNIRTALRSLYHTKRITYIAGSSLRYQTVRTVFPHEHDALILDATGQLTSISLIRKGLLAEMIETSSHASNSAAWFEKITAEFEKLAERFPLPRTIFLLAHEEDMPALKEVLDMTKFGALWLSDNPPRIVSVLASHVSGLIRQTARVSPPDLPLLLMALYFQYQKTEDIL